MNSKEYEQFSQFLNQQSGIHLGTGKEYLINSRLRKIMKEQRFTKFNDLLVNLEQKNSHLHSPVIDAMTTNETLWFRDEHPFCILQSKVLPDILNQTPHALNIWSAACSTGQEPYSITMAIEQFYKQNSHHYRCSHSILATDISYSAIARAKQGRYTQLALSRGLDSQQITENFKKHGDYWQINQRHKQSITFRQMNLKQTFFGLGQFDIIFCRNVLIYFNSDLKQKILHKMSQCLKPNGYLFIGASEGINELESHFDMIHCRPGIVYRKK